MSTISVKDLKKKQCCKGMHWIRSCTKVAKENKKSINNRPPQSN
jgi:hypothetical protein